MDVEALVRPVVESVGLELWEVTYRRERGRMVLRVDVDRDGGVDLDTIAQTSERLSRRLDLEGFAATTPYSLEVGSPGLERALKDPRHFQRSVGMRVKVKTVEPWKGGRCSRARWSRPMRRRSSSLPTGESCASPTGTSRRRAPSSSGGQGSSSEAVAARSRLRPAKAGAGK